jgi:cellulose synthase/poly-beta-1,6-N-acetylglucosamine synthase-like glycosyltransferase
MAYSHPLIEVFFLGSVVVLWAMIFYQLLFTFLGYVYHSRSLRELAAASGIKDENLQPVSILVPAHNEEIVIEKTIQSLLDMNYPRNMLEVIIVNDGSTDATADIVERWHEKDSRVSLFNVPEEEAAQGKSHALNLGLKTALYDLIAIYDADNNPEKNSLRYLVAQLLANPKLASTFGMFRTINRHKNLLTRFINIETLSFQYMIQAGRYLLSKIAILPGTNFVIRRSVLEECEGWDELALTEDSEISIRIYEMGYEIKFVPYAITWEQEPELWGTWVRQRTRWVRGNFYVLKKFLLPSFKFKKRSLTFELVYLFLLYYLFLGSILGSHLIFIASGLGYISVLSPGPYFAVWICAFLLFMAEITLACSYEEEASWKNTCITFLMYFTYCQAWIIIVFRAIYQEMTQSGKKWEKTRRFAPAASSEEEKERVING